MKKEPIDIILDGVQNGILNTEDAKTLLEAIYDHSTTSEIPIDLGSSFP